MHAGYNRRVRYDNEVLWTHTREIMAQMLNIHLAKANKPQVTGAELITLPFDKVKAKKTTRKKKAPTVSMARVQELERLLSSHS